MCTYNCGKKRKGKKKGKERKKERKREGREGGRRERYKNYSRTPG